MRLVCEMAIQSTLKNNKYLYNEYYGGYDARQTTLDLPKIQ